MKLIKTKTNKIHIISEESGKSICGQAPWTHPVIDLEGTLEEVTCKLCIEKEMRDR